MKSSVSPSRESIDGYHSVHLSCGATVKARCVLATTGVAWRRLDAKNAEKFERIGVYYACTAVEAELYGDCDVAVVGGGNSAGQAVMFLAEQCRERTVHMLVRGKLGVGMSDYLSARIRNTPNVKVYDGVVVSEVCGTNKIDELKIERRDTGEITTLPCQAAFVFIGAEPHADWLPKEVARDKLGYVLTGSDMVQAGHWPLQHRSPCPLETSVPGILAGGDLRSGSTKRVGFAVGDGSLAVTCVHRLRADNGPVAS
ncbi:MAG: NAD(P)/FAD-dependent oxidoreductase [Tepidisphaeraceae bacterium]